MSDPDQDSTDKRVQRSKKLVLTETYKLLSETGINGVSIDEISRRTGVAKTTIYRHWPSRAALLLDACSKIGARPEAPDTGSLKGDLTALLSHLANQLQSARWAVILPSIIDAAERDPELAQLHARLQIDLMAPFVAVVERAKRRGELARGDSVTGVVAAIVGPLFFRRWFSREPIDCRFVQSVVRSIAGPTKPK